MKQGSEGMADDCKDIVTGPKKEADELEDDEEDDEDEDEELDAAAPAGCPLRSCFIRAFNSFVACPSALYQFVLPWSW